MAGQWFSPGTLVSSTNKTDGHDIIEILLKVTLNTIKPSETTYCMCNLISVLAVVFRPDGDEIAVSTLDAQITFWNTQSVVQTGSIEGRHDLGYSRKEIDKITAKKSSFGKYVIL